MFVDAWVDQIVTAIEKAEKNIEDAQSSKAKYPVLLVSMSLFGRSLQRAQPGTQRIYVWDPGIEWNRRR